MRLKVSLNIPKPEAKRPQSQPSYLESVSKLRPRVGWGVSTPSVELSLARRFNAGRDAKHCSLVASATAEQQEFSRR